MIPEEAVDAAWNQARDASDGYPYPEREEIRRILEAAAPHMRPVITSVEGLRALPGGSIILDAEEYPAEKLYHNTQWWHQMGTHDGVNIEDISLPAVVLWEPPADD